MNGEEPKRTFRRRIADKSLALFISLVVSLLANVVFGVSWWYAIRDRVEITCSLAGWIPLGGVEEVELEELKITYAGQPVDNALKVTWRIANTGNKGIKDFEIPPSISYPEYLTVVKAFVSDKPKMLKVDKNATIDSEEGVIKLNNIGILNEDESLKLDVLIVNVTTADVSREYFGGWQFDAKALDLVTKMELETKQAMVSMEDGAYPYTWIWLSVGLGSALFVTIFSVFSTASARSRERDLGEKLLAAKEMGNMLNQELASLQSYLKRQQESEMGAIMSELESASNAAEQRIEAAVAAAILNLRGRLERYGISVEPAEHGAEEKAIRLRKGLSRMDIVIPSDSLTDYTERLRKMLFDEQDLS